MANAVPPKPTIALAMDRDGSVVIKPVSYLGSEFSSYLAAVAGSKFDRNRKCQLAPPALALGIASRLTAAGFALVVPPEVHAALHGTAVAVETAVHAAEDRAAKVDAILKSRGLGLFGFQRDGVRWLASRSAALLADDMGLGKTIQLLTALPEGAPVLVIAPAVAKGVWLREAAKWRPEFRVTVLSGRGSFRWPTPGEIVVVNYDILPSPERVATRGGRKVTIPSEIVPGPAGCVVICDEAHALKNSKAQRTINVRALIAARTGGAVWLGTATPLLNRPQELWTILATAGIATEAFGSWKAFVKAFGGVPGPWGGFEWGRPDSSVPASLRKVSLRRHKRDVLADLPAKIYRRIDAEIDGAAKRLCDKILASFAARGIKVEDGVLSGAAFTEMSAARAALAAAKSATLFELVEEYEESETPVVVFSAHRAAVDVIAARPGWAGITGDTAPEERTRIEGEFQAGKLKGIAATIKAGGVAITLTHASHVVFLDLEWTPALNQQAEDRCNRIGQTRGVVITHLVADHDLDERLYELLAVKESIICGSMEATNVTHVDVVLPEAPPATMVASDGPTATLETVIATVRAATRAAAPRDPAKTRRMPETAAEHFIAGALQSLAGNDPDHAAVINGVGFSKWDNDFGHSLAKQVSFPGLSVKQWEAARKLTVKYRGQVGVIPE